ncbi:glycogen synthase ADP-glucose transglucosylase [Candidatus Termititenax aidoneus]|uniref:starch synthase n=1 Tax=Termititenax aidoneus TaxID=2218524 RepID=A0A388T8I5_TERA1|nr:glycogen synthase ADP-glucose transglucosylase [Candidatus Termititenax aidoneus]
MQTKMVSYYSPAEEALLRESKVPYILRPDFWQSRNFRLMLVSSEYAPLGIRSGGLADVAGNLAAALAGLGVDVNVVIPYYLQAKSWLFHHRAREVNNSDDLSAYLDSNPFWQASKYYQENHRPSLLHIDLDKNLTCTLISTSDQDYFGKTKPLYNGMNAEHGDSERFTLFNWLAAGYLNLRLEQYDSPVHLLHLNDWTSGLIPFFEKLLNARVNTPALFSLHNIYSGALEMDFFNQLTGNAGDAGYGFVFDPLHRGGFHINNHLDLLAAGLKWSDQVMTVSPRYHEELTHNPHFSGPYTGIIRQLEEEQIFGGITNGYNSSFELEAVLKNFPEVAVPTISNSTDLLAARRQIKRIMQLECGLRQDEDAMLIGYVNRLAEQKSYQETAEVMRRLLSSPQGQRAQFIVVTTAQTDEELAKKEFFLSLQREFPGRVAVLPYSDALACRINPALDLHLMPSKYEPCGISQLNCYAVGTPTLANNVGGLHDTIVDDGNTASQTGYLFNGFAEDGSLQPERFLAKFQEGLERAVADYQDRKRWTKLVENAYAKRLEYTWPAIAEKYLYWYGHIIARRMLRAYAWQNGQPQEYIFRPEWLMPPR